MRFLSFALTLVLCVAVFLAATNSAQQLPKVEQVELQPLTAQVRRLIEREEARLKLYREHEQRAFAGRVDTRERRLQHLVVTSGIRMVSLRIEIAKEALEILGMEVGRDGES